MRLRVLIYLLAVTLMGLLLYSCASIGSPEGGPRDYTPPQVVKSSPADGQLNVRDNKINITFNEIVTVNDVMKRVVVSPTQRNMPIVKALGKRVTVELRDTLLPGTTYCIDFTNAIEDNNEGNVLDGYAMAFSTGDSIDTLQMSGMVLRARDLEPMQQVLVGLHSNLDDSAFVKLPFDRISRTNDRGQFRLRNLKPGRYRVFALNDMDNNYRMARTEDIAFLDEVVVPSTSTYISQDTVFTYDHRVDTVTTAEHTDFLPNNLLLCMFNENYRAHYLKTSSRLADNRLHVLLSAPVDTLPTLEIVSPARHEAHWCRLEYRPGNDSIIYWLTDSALIKSDSIVARLTYLRTDSADRVLPQTDTLTFALRKTGNQLKEEAKLKKECERRDKRRMQLEEKLAQGKQLSPDEEDELAHPDTLPAPRLKVEPVKAGELDIGDSISLKFETPVAHIDPAGIHLDVRRDTLWVPLAGVPRFEQAAPGNPLRYSLPQTLAPDSSYRLTVDTLAITDVYGITNDPMVKTFKVRGAEQYANLQISITGVRDSAFVELLDQSEKVAATAPVVAGKVSLRNVKPGNYYLKLTVDRNGNGRWDTGNYALHLQPEEVYYLPRRLKLRANWDMEQQWNIYETPLDLQKPADIKRNKPEGKKWDKKKTGTTATDEEEDDEFGSSGFGNSIYSGNKYNDYRNNK